MLPIDHEPPLDKGDHLEMDTSEFLGSNEIQHYQSLIGAMQWAISIGCFDNVTVIMTVLSFCTMPCCGHLEHVKHIYGYLAKMKEADIHILTKEPDYSELGDTKDDWAKRVYGEMGERNSDDIPKPLGNWATLSHYFNANLLYHDMVTCHMVTGILHLIRRAHNFRGHLSGIIFTFIYV